MRLPSPRLTPPAGRLVVALIALVAPTAIAFADGGYFEGARAVALVGAGLVCVLTALVVPARDLIPSRPALLALGGLAALTAWTAISTSWAPSSDPAWATAERDALYLAALAATTLLLAEPRALARLVEPVLLAGIVVVIGYGLLGRLLPDILNVVSSPSAGGRLDQPLTYWNAVGALAAVGTVLAARLAGDDTRAPMLRSAAAAAAVPLLVGLYLTFSRGAIAACVAGLVVLLAVAPSFTQLRAAVIVAEAGVIGAALAAASPYVRTLHGSHPGLQGAAVLIALLAIMLLAALTQTWAVRVERDGTTRLGRLPLPRHHGYVAAALVAAMLVVPVAIAAGSDTPSSVDPRFGSSTSRLASADSPRYEYWRVAIESFADHPVQGVGAGGFAVEWLRERTEANPARDAHSLPIETLAELGIIGAAALALLIAGIAIATRRVLRADPVLAAGPAAALVAYAFHASIDWDWEMPALSLVAVVLAGQMLARSRTSTATAPSTTSAGSAANRNRVEP
ncbi:O-antigen ligase family protein [Baekduia sp. Peel2402]|uniref:O-antigen ligase family protein n=1 Tax=Baekduia sp. Peel2402 TaxID=3458296 RepID=UPI00403EB5D7